MVLGHAAAGRRFGGRGGRGGWWGASVGGGAAQFRRRGELGLAPSENRRIGRTKLTKYPYLALAVEQSETAMRALIDREARDDR